MEELGKRIVLNVVMVGFLAAVTGLLLPQALREAVYDSVPPAARELNLKAFDKGYDYGTAHVKEVFPANDENQPLLLENI